MREIVEKALSSLGKGFDLTSDFRLKYCKGRNRLVWLNEAEKHHLSVPGFGDFKDVSMDIKCDKGDRTRYQSDILEFGQMAELFNQKTSVNGRIPSGLFNSMFGFQSSSWATDAANTKYLGLDGYYISLFNVHIDRYPLTLADEIRDAVPSAWDPAALARFIEKYGTHIVVGLSIGGADIVVVRQDKSSTMEPSQLKSHLDDLGDQLFTGTCTYSPLQLKNKRVPPAFNVFDPQPNSINFFTAITNKDVSSKDGITVICSKRGGDTTTSTHSEWILTVPSKPDAIQFSFIPITSLLNGVRGKGFLSHAINLYLRYKPPITDLQYFLDFQTHKIWAPLHNDLPLGPVRNKALSTPSLHFNPMGPKLYVNTTQVTVGEKPITGMRLYLEGMKCNRLAIHLQHLSNTPILFQDRITQHLNWQGTEDTTDDRFLEAVQWKKFSHACTAPVKYDPKWATRKDDAFIVTGAQLLVTKHDAKSVLHLRLLFTKISKCNIVQSNWMQSSGEQSAVKLSLLSALSTSISGNLDNEKSPVPVLVDSGVYPTGPPVPVQMNKLLKCVDTSELCKGPHDNPGHWLVTGAKLDLEKGKICLHVKFSLLNLSN